MGPRGRRRSYRCSVQPLTPLMEGPDVEVVHSEGGKKESSWDAIRSWVRAHVDRGVPSPSGHLPVFLNSSSSSKRVDLRLTLGVLGCPLAPISLPVEPSLQRVLSFKDDPLATTSAQYIIQQYLAATGCLKPTKSVKNVYTAGTLRMACCETESNSGKHVRNAGRSGGESGCFVLWQMSPGMWSVELGVAGCKVVAGSNGKIVWRHMPWLGTHAAKGPLRPLRRIIQGLDPKSTAGMFAKAQCVGEKRVGGEDCFVLKVSADQATVAERSEGPAEVIRHVLYGYFSQRSGLLAYLEDSHLARVQTTATDTVYWETTIGSSIGDYRDVDGVLVAHQGRSVATIFRFGEATADAASHHSRTTMEEVWRIDDVVFNVPGLSMDYFIPPAELLTSVNNPSP